MKRMHLKKIFKGLSDSFKAKDLMYIYAQMVMSVMTLFFVVVIIIGFSSYLVSSGTIKAKVSEVEVRTLEQIQSMVDNDMEKAITLMSNISNHYFLRHDFNELTTDEKLLLISGATFPYRIDSFIASVYIYYFKSDKVVRPAGGAMDFSMMDDIGWWDIYNENGLTSTAGDFIISRTMKGSSSIPSEKVITIMRNFPQTATKKEGVAVVNISISTLLEGAFRHMPEGDTLLVLDDDNRLLAGDNSIFSQLSHADVFSLLPETGSGYESVDIDGRGMLMSYAKTSVAGLNFIKLQSVSSLMRDVERVRNVTLILAVMGLIFGIFMLMNISKKLYSPFLPMATRLLELGAKKVDGVPKSDFDMLSEVVDDIAYRINQEQTGRDMWESTALILRAVYKGNTAMADSIRATLEQLGIYYEGACLGVAYFKARGAYSGQRAEELLNNFQKICEKKKDEIRTICDVISDNTIMLIAALENDTIYETFCEHVCNSTGFSAALGGLYTDPADLFISAKEGAELLRMMVFSDESLISTANSPEISSDSENNAGYAYPLAREIEFIEAIEQGNEEESILIAREICSKIPRNGETAEHVSELIWRIANGLFIGLNAIGVSYEAAVGSPFFENYLAYKRLDRMSDMLCNIEKQIRAAMFFMQGRRQDKNSTVIEGIKTYIDQNYQKNLSIEIIGDLVHMSSVYVGALFREGTGQALGAYITEVRINKAKELLKNSNHDLRRIATETGFESMRTFFRVFKKITGQTPSEYRQVTAVNKLLENNTKV